MCLPIVFVLSSCLSFFFRAVVIVVVVIRGLGHHVFVSCDWTLC